ncbi:MAG: hypothetical protein IPI54_15645 [Chitinophagaceae bacterium]|nr:hypothetical protein [Chitinophagaceae bacterium]
MDKQKVIFQDLGIIDYKTAWDYQENLLQENVRIKSALRNAPNPADVQSSILKTANDLTTPDSRLPAPDSQLPTPDSRFTTTNYFLICEHPPVYTLGKSGKKNMCL